MPERQTSPAEVNADEGSPDGAHSNGAGPDGWSPDDVSFDGGHPHEPAPVDDPGPNDLFTPRTPAVPADPADAGGGSHHDGVTGAESGDAAHEPVSDGSG